MVGGGVGGWVGGGGGYCFLFSKIKNMTILKITILFMKKTTMQAGDNERIIMNGLK